MNAAWSDKPFAERVGLMGDLAEQAFETHWDGGAFVRTGLNRPEGIRVYDLPDMVRFTPDYLVQQGYMECVGVGNDGILKTKSSKLQALEGWSRHVALVQLFVWHSTSSRWCVVRFEEFQHLLFRHGYQSKFTDGVPLWGLNVHHLQRWHDVN